jgi:prevent-host-death family protein
MTMEIKMLQHMEQKISAGDFKAGCLKLMDEVQKKKKTVLITKRGIPVARLVPVDLVSPGIFGWLKGTVVQHGDITEPIDMDWNVNAQR